MGQGLEVCARAGVAKGSDPVRPRAQSPGDTDVARGTRVPASATLSREPRAQRLPPSAAGWSPQRDPTASVLTDAGVGAQSSLASGSGGAKGPGGSSTGGSQSLTLTRPTGPPATGGGGGEARTGAVSDSAHRRTRGGYAGSPSRTSTFGYGCNVISAASANYGSSISGRGETCRRRNPTRRWPSARLLSRWSERVAARSSRRSHGNPRHPRRRGGAGRVPRSFRSSWRPSSRWRRQGPGL